LPGSVYAGTDSDYDAPEEDEARRRAHHALDEITRLLHKQEPLSEKEELMLKAQCHVLKITEDVD